LVVCSYIDPPWVIVEQFYHLCTCPVLPDQLFPHGKEIDTRFLIISFKSDWLYPSYQSQEIVRELKMNCVDATYCELQSTYGHDAFLVEVEEQTTLIKHFLDKTFNGYLVGYCQFNCVNFS